MIHRMHTTSGPQLLYVTTAPAYTCASSCDPPIIMSVLPTTQKAWLVVRRGPPDVALELVHDAPVPTELQDGEVLVKVGAAALNPVSVSSRRRLHRLV
jgi:hypothetical protein